MTSQKFGNGLNGDVRTEFEGPLVERGGERVIHAENRARFPWRGANGVQIRNGEEGI